MCQTIYPYYEKYKIVIKKIKKKKKKKKKKKYKYIM